MESQRLTTAEARQIVTAQLVRAELRRAEMPYVNSDNQTALEEIAKIISGYLREYDTPAPDPTMRIHYRDAMRVWLDNVEDYIEDGTA